MCDYAALQTVTSARRAARTTLLLYCHLLQSPPPMYHLRTTPTITPSVMHPLKVLLLLLIPFISILGPFFSLADNVLPQLHCKTVHISMACRIPFSQGTLLVLSRLKRVKPPPAPVFRRTDDASPSLPGSFFAHPAYGSRLIISHRMLMGNDDDNASRLHVVAEGGGSQNLLESILHMAGWSRDKEICSPLNTLRHRHRAYFGS